MDPLTDLVDTPRARGAFLLRVTMRAPWSVRVADEAPLTVVALTAGSASYQPDDEPPVALRAGDVLLVRGPGAYVVADRAHRPAQAVIHPGGRCETPDGVSLELPMRQGVRSWGNDATGADAMLVGTYLAAGEVGARILRSLPREVLLRAGDGRSERVSRLVEILAEEVPQDGLGQASLLDRLLDALVVAGVREWFASPGVRAPEWLSANGDPVVRRALSLLHDDPAAPWTVASLARAVGMSRAGLARRFSDGVGEPPMGYLAGWRLALAADRLRESDDTVSAVARSVGYASPFTFSTAFKRRYGVSPQGWRRTPAAAPTLAQVAP